MAQAANAVQQAKRYDDLAQRGIAHTRAGGHVANHRHGAERDRRRGQGGGRERESAAAVRDDPRADHRPHRRADGARGQPGSRQRSDGARRDQSGHADLRLFRDSGSAAARAEEVHGRRRAARHRESRRTTTPHRPSVASRFVDNAVDQTTGTIKIKGTFPNADRRLWPGQYVNVVVTLTHGPAGDRGAVGRRSGRPAGILRVRRQRGAEGRSASGDRRAHDARRRP